MRTNQEMYNDLGELGSIQFLGILIAGVDGSVDDSELEAVGNSFARFASNEADNMDNFKRIWENVMNVFTELENFENRFNFAVEVLRHWKDKFSDDTKKAMMLEFVKVANADEELHDNEAKLLGAYAKILLAD